MSEKRYSDQFKVESIKQITEQGHSVQDVSQRLGGSAHSLYAWLKKYGNRPRFCRILRIHRSGLVSTA